jgi:hypothetical protein
MVPFGEPHASKKMPETLPKTGLPGVVCVQWVRCGRPNCRCAGGRRHGPYHYRFFRDAGKLKKVYVGRADLEEVRARCNARRRLRQELALSLREWQRLTTFLREVESR